MTAPALRALVLDIEGTTTLISFVHDILFPYAARALPGFLAERWHDAPVQEALADLRAQHDADRAAGLNPPVLPSPEADDEAARAATLANIRWLMAHDRKVTGLKQLQGLIWRGGYLSGDLKGQLFDDVPEVLRALAERQLPVYIYSSGSVAAQRLLFGYSEAGDLTPLLSGYFDTTTGPKKEAASYTLIAQAIDLPPATILFATDHPSEARAATSAGLQVALMDRPGNAPPPDGHPFEVQQDLRFVLERLG